MSDNDDLVARARTFAEVAHAGDVRKGSEVPYFDGHLEPVAELVRGAGGSPVQIAAAYLHDAAEDHGGLAMLDRIRDEFGPEVADIVDHLSDSLADTTEGEAKPPWIERKATYVEALATKPTTSLEVSVADKLHNASSIRDDYVAVGDELWTRFNEQRPEGQLWYYTSLADVFRDRIPDSPLVAQLDEVLADLQQRARADQPELSQSGPWSAPV